MNKYSWIDIVGSSLEKLVRILENRSSPWIDNNIGQADILCKRLKFFIVFLQDAPLQCIEIEGSENILKEIESISDEAKIFVDSFLSTIDHVTTVKMDVELSLLLSKIEVVEEKIKDHCTMVFEQQTCTTPKLTSASLYIIHSLLDDLNHLLNHKFDLVVDVKDQIKMLYDELCSSRSMLMDIMLHHNKELVEYEKQLIYLSYEVEYVIACFAAGDVPVWYLSFRLSSFIKKCKPIQASLTKIKVNSSIRGVQVLESSREVFPSGVTTESIPEVDDIIVGFKETTKQIADQLFGGPGSLQIIAIVGMGGLGKTTLARKLYNHSYAILHFDKRAWCIASQTYQKRKLLIDILSCVSSLNKYDILEMEDHQLIENIYKSLKGARYLLVVDDIWEKSVWDDLKRYFPNDTNGSRIIFTSRSKDVALQDSCEPIIHNLPLLTQNECWDLLQKKVFPNCVCSQELQDVGKEIVRNCKGLPLVVASIAAVLANMDKKESLWQEVATNLASYIFKDQNTLELSYEHLPSRLKPCFLYLGVFREDEKIPARKLFSLWVSSGFIPKNEHKVLEDTAEDFLRELINRSLVQVTERRSDNGVKSFMMHDLIRDMCLRLGDKEKFLTVINDGPDGEFPTIFKQHHHIRHRSHFCYCSSGLVRQHFRSLFDESYHLYGTPSMKRLRVFKSQNPYTESILKSVVQLRYFECDGSYSNSVSHTHLEVLRVKNLAESCIQLHLPKLRHLHLGRPRSYLPLKLLAICETNSLQTLSGIIIENLEDDERLICFSHLRCLKCEYAKSWVEWSANLIFLTELVSLNIRGYDRYTKPKAINFPIHIKKLSISKMSLSPRLLLSIGTLPHLEILKLYCVQFEERRWNTSDGEFQKLKFFKLDDVIFNKWNTFEDHFPVLEHLVLKDCRPLDLLPSELGYIPTLQMIEVSNCHKDLYNSAVDLKKEQEEAGNELLKIIVFDPYDCGVPNCELMCY